MYIRGAILLNSYEFKGTIEMITYDTKLIPTVQVENKRYYLYPTMKFYRTVIVGDYISKEKGGSEFTVIRKSNGQISKFHN